MAIIGDVPSKMKVEPWATIENIRGGQVDGRTASYYELPEGATELKHLIWYKRMNAQVGEIFRSTYRYEDCPHSDKRRNMQKVIAYAEQELERLDKYGE